MLPNAGQVYSRAAELVGTASVLLIMHARPSDPRVSLLDSVLISGQNFVHSNLKAALKCRRWKTLVLTSKLLEGRDTSTTIV